MSLSFLMGLMSDELVWLGNQKRYSWIRSYSKIITMGKTSIILNRVLSQLSDQWSTVQFMDLCYSIQIQPYEIINTFGVFFLWMNPILIKTMQGVHVYNGGLNIRSFMSSTVNAFNFKTWRNIMTTIYLLLDQEQTPNQLRRTIISLEL